MLAQVGVLWMVMVVMLRLRGVECAAASVPVTSCDSYLLPATNYILQNNLQYTYSDAKPDCISILGAYATFDGNGFTITSISGGGTGINVNGKGAIVKNTIVKGGFDNGIWLNDSCDGCSVFNNTISNVTLNGIRATGKNSNITANLIFSLSGNSVCGINQTGNTAVIGNTIHSISGNNPTGIFYNNDDKFGGNIQNNTIYDILFTTGSCSGVPEAIGILVNITDAVYVIGNIIYNIGGGGCLLGSTNANASGLYFITLVSLDSTPSVAYANNITSIQGGQRGGNSRAFACDNYSLFKIVSFYANYIYNINANGLGTSYGIYSAACNVDAEYNYISSVSGSNAYGIAGASFGYFNAAYNNISELHATSAFSLASVGMAFELPNNVLLYNLTMYNNNVDEKTPVKYFLYHQDLDTDVCGNRTGYQNSNSMCFPPGINCCSTECLPLCPTPDSCGPNCAPLVINCTDCDCGDGTCGPGENCSTCSADCVCGSSCKDQICDPNENCTTCPEDCGKCSPLCPSDCSGHGQCVETGICVCDENYGGPACDRTTTSFVFDTNTTFPGALISYTESGHYYQFNISLDFIREVKWTGEPVRNVSLAGVTFYPVPLFFLTLLNPNITVYKSLYGVLPNGAKILFTMVTLTGRVSIPFGFFKISLPPQAIKYNVLIWDWPFLSIFNQLEVYTNQYVTNADHSFTNYAYNDTYGNLRYQEFVDPVTNSSLFINIPPYMIVDGTIRRMQVRQTELGMATVLPFFIFGAQYDPDYSVLLGADSSSSSGGGGGTSGKKSNNLDKTALIIGVTVSVGGLLIIVVAIVIIWPRVQLRHQVRESDKAEKEQRYSEATDESRNSLTVRM